MILKDFFFNFLSKDLWITKKPDQPIFSSKEALSHTQRKLNERWLTITSNNHLLLWEGSHDLQHADLKQRNTHNGQLWKRREKMPSFTLERNTTYNAGIQMDSSSSLSDSTFQSISLIMHLAKQWKMARTLRTLCPCGRPGKSSCFVALIGSAQTIVLIWGVNCGGRMFLSVALRCEPALPLQ